MGEFSEKVVVVTGGSRGIGNAIAASFAREGAQTVLAASSQANLDKAAARDRQLGAEAAYLRRRSEEARGLRGAACFREREGSGVATCW